MSTKKLNNRTFFLKINFNYMGPPPRGGILLKLIQLK